MQSTAGLEYCASFGVFVYFWEENKHRGDLVFVVFFGLCFAVERGKNDMPVTI